MLILHLQTFKSSYIRHFLVSISVLIYFFHGSLTWNTLILWAVIHSWFSFLDPLGGVKNLKVIDPTISTLTVRWDPAVGNVRSYKVFYAAQPGGEEKMVEWVLCG